MIKRKATKKYYFTVEGETEKWYLDWPRERINECADSDYKVSFDAQVQKNPLKRAKSLAVTGKTEIWHTLRRFAFFTNHFRPIPPPEVLCRPYDRYERLLSDCRTKTLKTEL